MGWKRQSCGIITPHESVDDRRGVARVSEFWLGFVEGLAILVVIAVVAIVWYVVLIVRAVGKS